MKFVTNLNKEKYLFIFLLGSVVGTIYEDLLQGIKNLINIGVFQFDLHRGVIYGPFNIIYGLGACLMIMLLTQKSQKWYQIFLKGSLIGGIFEYFVSFIQEKFLGSTSWDYSDLPLNIQGRTTIPIMIIWGIMCVILVKFVYPLISNIIEKIPSKVEKKLYLVLSIFISLDMLVSWTALIRQNLRHEGYKPFTIVGKVYDKYYTDEFLKKYFANMKGK